MASEIEEVDESTPSPSLHLLLEPRHFESIPSLYVSEFDTPSQLGKGLRARPYLVKVTSPGKKEK
jgi:hypothetical protein